MNNFLSFMEVEFKKTGKRRYAVFIWRSGQHDIKMDPAPGFDPLMPHDLLHFIVEQELGLRKGVFGNIALGGTAGTFQNELSTKSNKRTNARLRRKAVKKDKQIAKQGPSDYDQSERATIVCLYSWLSHSKSSKLRNRAKEIKIDAKSTLARMPVDERTFLNKHLPTIRLRMDELSERWSMLKDGESIKLKWSH